MVDDESVFSSILANNEEARDIYGELKICPCIVTQNNSTSITPIDAYSFVNIVPQLDQNRAELRTALDNPSNAAATQK